MLSIVSILCLLSKLFSRLSVMYLISVALFSMLAIHSVDIVVPAIQRAGTIRLDQLQYGRYDCHEDDPLLSWTLMLLVVIQEEFN